MRAPGTAYAMKTAIIAVLFLLALPAAASAVDGARRPGRRGALDRGRQGWLRHVRGTASKVWHTLDDGALTEVFYPDLGTPSVRDARLRRLRRQDVRRARQRGRDAASSCSTPRSLTYRQVNAASPAAFGSPRPTSTDPARNVAPRGRPLQVARPARSLRLYALYDPAPRQRRHGRQRRDRAATRCYASDAGSPVSSALVASPAFTRTSNGYLGRERRLDGPAPTSAWTGLHVGARRQRRPDRADVAHRGRGAPAADARARLRRDGAPALTAPRLAGRGFAAARSTATRPAGTPTSAG